VITVAADMDGGALTVRSEGNPTGHWSIVKILDATFPTRANARGIPVTATEFQRR
jgi:hypothetical protein